MIVYFKNILNKSTNILYLLYIVVFITISLGQIARWDLLEQVAMADNYIANGDLYPDFRANEIHGVSVYFPGIAYLAILFQLIGIKFYLVEFLLLFAVIIFIFFIYLIIFLTKSIYPKRVYPKELIFLLLAYLTIVCPKFVMYALEFKPDTIALLLGLTGVLWIFEDAIFVYKKIIAIFLIGIAVFFKQQYLFFILGIFVSIFIIKKGSYKIFALISIIISSLFFIIIISNKNLVFWNFEILSDDGIVSFKFILTEIIPIAINIITFILLLILSIEKNHIVQINKSFFLDLIKNHPWAIIFPFIIASCIISFLKVGGNRGNLELGLVFIFPLILIFINYLSKWKVILIAWFGILITFANNLSSPIRYIEAKDLRNKIMIMESNNFKSVLTGSDVYYASRFLNRNGLVIENYWSQCMKNNISVEKQLSISLQKKYDLIIVENWPENYTAIINSNNYNVIFQNSIGLIAKAKLP